MSNQHDRYLDFPVFLNESQRNILDNLAFRRSSPIPPEIIIINHARGVGATSALLHYCYNYNYNFVPENIHKNNYYVTNRSFSNFYSSLPKNKSVEFISSSKLKHFFKGKTNIGIVIVDNGIFGMPEDAIEDLAKSLIYKECEQIIFATDGDGSLISKVKDIVQKFPIKTHKIKWLPS